MLTFAFANEMIDKIDIVSFKQLVLDTIARAFPPNQYRQRLVVSMFDVDKIRQDFPILEQKIRNKPLVYLDNAASSQKPNAVIDAICNNYRNDYANIHRGVHTLSERSTAAIMKRRAVR